MKNKTKMIMLGLVLSLFTAKAQVDDQTKFNMFCTALDNYSTAPNYVVITVKNKKTGLTKEVCTETPFLEGAVKRETGKQSIINCKDYKTRYFEFSKDSALWNISFDFYTKSDLDKYAKTINVQEIVQEVKSGKLTSKTFKGGEAKNQIMFAHLMFNNGVLITRGCIAGNVCGLTYFKSK